MHDEKKHHGRFMEGLFWGAVVGGAATYLLSHKKGREFLKELLEDGLDFIEEKTNPVVEEAIFEEQTTIASQPESPVVDVKEALSEVKSEAPKPPASKKRFFRSSKKSK